MAVKIKTVLPRVKALLEQDRLLADNDSRLITLMWKEDLIKKGMDLSTLNVLDFFNLYENGILTSAESVRRNRQAIEHAIPHLRGDTYELRHNIREKEIRKEIQVETFSEIVKDRYTQINQKIFDSLKINDEVYFTTPEAKCWCSTVMDCNLQRSLVIGKKYTIENISNVYGLYASITINNMILNPAFFSILQGK